MVKVGDQIRSVTDCDFGISVGSIYVVENIRNMGDSSYVWFNDSNDKPRVRDFRHYELVTEAPPATIQHEGYNYTRGEPVVPDWVKDGAWVVRKDNGYIHQVKETKSGIFHLTIDSEYSIRITHHIYGQYRPFTNSDWKWGMWAEYRGEKVFVCENSALGVYASKKNDPYFFAPYDELTPTTAP